MLTTEESFQAPGKGKISFLQHMDMSISTNPGQVSSFQVGDQHIMHLTDFVGAFCYSLYVSRDAAQGFAHGRQVLYQLTHSPNSVMAFDI